MYGVRKESDMRVAVRKLTKLNELYDTSWFTIEIRVVNGRPIYQLVHHFLSGTTSYAWFDTIASLNSGMSAYIQDVERNK